MRILGVVLVVLGIIALAYGGIAYTKREKVVDVGPIQATVDKKERLPLSPWAGGAALVTGIALIVLSRRTTTAP